MINYEITVDVSNLSVVEKMRVQDAFFELGVGWPVYGKKYMYLNKNTYTNLYMRDYVVNHLLFSDSRLPATHTPEGLFELVKQIKHSKNTSKGEGNMSKINLKQRANLKPFNLEAALAGEPVVTRDGREVFQVTLFECESKYPLCAVVDGDICSFTETGGHYYNGQPSQYDLFMKPKTHIVNGFEVPAPESEPLKTNVKYYCSDSSEPDWFFWSTWVGDETDTMWLARNLVFLNKEDAIANAKAMLGIDPYKE